VKTKAISVLLVVCVLLAAAPISARASDVPAQAYISGVVGHAQRFSLSCEARSAADWAAYWGVNIDEAQFLDRLPESDNPNEGFVGNANDPWGYIPPASYGVHADPVARMLRNYGLDAHAGHDLSWGEVQVEIAAGRPVIVWVIGSIWAGTPKQIETQDGQTVTVANNEHTMILIGYSETNVQLVDALTGYTVTYSLDNFLISWSVLGNMAVVGEGSQEQEAAITEEAAAAQEENPSYTVEPGDTLNKLAARLSLSWVDLAAWNDISYPYTIVPGQSLVLSGPAAETSAKPTQPAGSETYSVQRGDGLMKIARDLELDWEQLAEINDLAPPYLLFPGNVLKLPGSADEQVAQTTEVPFEVPEFYTAQTSESLFALAHYYGLDWIQLAGMNDINFPYMLDPGQTIRLLK
jgi:LysM repeat protein